MQKNQDLKKGQTKPPLGRTTWLLIQPPSGPARNDTTFAMSSGMPSRSSGFIFFNSSISASLLPFKNRSVRTWPGATALTVMFLPRSSLASTWTNPSTPAFRNMLRRLSEYQKRSAQVRRDHLVEGSHVSAGNRKQRHDARTMNHHIRPAEGFHRPFEEPLHVCGNRHICLHSDPLSPLS